MPTQGVRLMLSGVFEAYPNLKTIVGHLGESLPFSLWRTNNAMSKPWNKPVSFRDNFVRHF
jgi:2,3-dihydroxybenzoate decarboxylase